MTAEDRLMRRLRWAAGFLIAGIAVQVGTLLWSHPAAFLFFVLIGGLLEVLGMAIYLLAVAHPGQWGFLRRRRHPSSPDFPRDS